MLLEGIFPAATTPFYPDGRLYLKKLEHNVERYSRTAVAGLVILGSTGEAVMLGEDESRQVLRAARDAAVPEKVLLAGVGRESVSETLRLIEHAADLQYDAVLVRTPSYYPYCNVEMLTYYRALADRSPLPVVIYSIPKFTRYEIPVEVVVELAQHPNIIGIKDSSGSVERIAALTAATRNVQRRQIDVTPFFSAFTTRMMLNESMLLGSFVSAESLVGPIIAPPPPRDLTKTMRKKEVGFQVLAGAAAGFVDSLNAGASGGVLAIAAFAPQACQDIYTAWKDNDTPLAALKQQRVSDSSAVVLGKYGIAGAKHACDLNGYYGGRPRLPLLPLDADQQSEVARAIADLRS